MKLHLTATSERGKPVTKSGNDYLDLDIRGENRNKIAKICITVEKQDATDKEHIKIAFHVEGEKSSFYNLYTEPKTAREKQCDKCSVNMTDLDYINGSGRCVDCFGKK